MPIINHAFLSPRLVIIIPMTLGPMEPPIPYISGSVAFTRPRWEAGVILVIKVLAFIEISISPIVTKKITIKNKNKLDINPQLPRDKAYNKPPKAITDKILNFLVSRVKRGVNKTTTMALQLASIPKYLAPIPSPNKVASCNGIAKLHWDETK